MSETPTPITHAKHLGAVLVFNDADLKANHAGVISDAQSQRIQRESRQTSCMFWGNAILFALFAGANSTHWNWVVILLPLPFILLAFRNQHKTHKALIANKALMLSGVLTRYGTWSVIARLMHAPGIHKIMIEGKEFVVPIPLYLRLMDNQHYTLYYVPGIDHILSAELISDGEDDEKEKRLSDASAEETSEPAREANTQQTSGYEEQR